LALAGYLSISGDDARAARAATAALDAAERSGDVPAQARSLIHLWTGTNRNSDVHRDHSHLQRAFALLEPLGPTPELASVCQLMAVGDPAEELRGVRSRLRAIAKAHGPGRQDWLTRELSWLHSDGDWDEFLELASQVPDPARPDFEVPRRMVMFTAVARTGRR